MEKLKAFFIVLVLASVGGFVVAFLLGLLVHSDNGNTVAG